jgi:hypothetical protein
MIRLRSCVHFRGIQHDVCGAGVRLLDVRVVPEKGPYRWPCVERNRDLENCPKRVFPTDEQEAEREAEFEAAWAAVAASQSSCCGAPLDESRVIDGSGWRYCMNCKEPVFHGCTRHADMDQDL